MRSLRQGVTLVRLGNNCFQGRGVWETKGVVCRRWLACNIVLPKCKLKLFF